MDSLALKITHEFESVKEHLIERELLIDTNPLIPLSSAKSTTLSWSTSAQLSYLFGTYTDLNQYVSILNLRDFSFCFADGGLVQIYYVIENREIKSHRLAYIPCPISFSQEEAQSVPLDELPLLFDADELRARFRLVSPVRFDYDYDKVDDKHAHSHVSINKDTCRVPAYGPISLGHFFRFVLRYFYESDFDAVDTWDNIIPQIYQRSLPHPPPHELHFDTAVGY